MNVINIIDNVFCDYSNYESLDISLAEHISALNLFLDKKLASQSFDLPNDRNEGKLGPSITVFDVDETDNSVKVSKDYLTLQSQSAFSTQKANSCVFKGQWMYEVQLRSKGVMQIGFCSHECKFTQDTGVGDTRFSYGLDGSKQRIWHVYTKKYGPYWRSGDIFGVCVDLDEGKIEYYRNGVNLGEAFKNLERGPGLALYPAVSLAYNDSLTANFGGSPFKHPIKAYKAFQEPPLAMLFKAECLLQYLVNLARVMSRHKPANGTSAGTDSVSNETVFMLVGSMLVEKCAPLLTNSYVVEDKVFSYIRSMCVLRSNIDHRESSPIQPGAPDSTLGSFLTILWTYMELEEMQLFLKKLVNFLANTYRETPVDLEYEKQRMIIVILSCICNHPQTRKYLLQFKLFTKNCLPLFLYTKPPDESTLEQLLPDDHIWTEGLGGSREHYMAACNRLQNCTMTLYTLQKNLINTLLINTDGCDHTPSSRKIFMKNLRKFVMENSLEHRALLIIQGNTTSPTQPAVGLSFLCCLLDVARQLWADETRSNVVFIDSINFCDGTFMYNNIDRIGGLLSHLKKTYRQQLGAFLGVDHPVMTNDSYEQIQSDFQDIYAAMFLITGASTNNISTLGDENQDLTAPTANQPPEVKKLTPGNMDERKSICELIDCSILFYYAVAHKYVVMIADLRDNIAHLSDILIETKESCDDVVKSLADLNNSSCGSDFQPTHDEILNELNEKFGHRKSIFAKRSIEFSRKQAWYRSVALGPQRRKLLCWLLEVLFNTLSNISKQGALFGFVPETYINILPILLDTVLDFSFHDTGVQHNLTGSADLVNAAGEFLGTHLADSRVVLASCKDSMIQAIGALTCHQKGIQALEQASEKSQNLLVEALLRPYENRAWGQSNWLLLRFWLGEGFAFRESRPACIWQGGQSRHSLGLYRSRSKSGSSGLLHLIAPACPSRHFQFLIGSMLANDEPFCTKFLNSLLSQLNWGFSEFIHILQDIQNTTQREEQQPIDSKQLKIGAMCFELTVSLMRALEMILSIVPTIFLDQTRPNSDILLGRICQLVIQVLSRVTVPPGCFQHVIDLCLPDLSYVTHFSIITAAIGILLALMKNELNFEENVFKIPKISRIILTDPSFQIAHLQFALGVIDHPTGLAAAIPRGNFDPQMRANSETSRASPKRTACGREIIPDPPIIQFDLRDYPNHVSEEEMQRVRSLIRILEKRQTLLSEITILSEDTLCSICYAKQNSTTFEPCHHQSCDNCIIQHLMSNKCCFYCKIHIVRVCKYDGTCVYEASPTQPKVSSAHDSDDNDFNDDESIV